MKQRELTWLRKKARKGPRTFPAATIAFYGPDDRRASKVAVSIILAPEQEPAYLERWYSEDRDLRVDSETLLAVSTFIRSHGVSSVIMVETIIGCPHEEGVDYPEGESCSQCTFWKGRDRWTSERNH